MAMAVRQRDHSGGRRSLRRGAFRGDRLASRASHVRARALFMVLDALAVALAYGVAEVTYFRDRPPAGYWQHFSLFLVLVLVVHLGANWLFGLYGRIWRYAGIEEARQVVLSALASLVVLAALRPLWRLLRLELVPLQVVLVGCVFVTMAMGALRFHSRLFAWQRGTHRVGLRVAVIGSRDAGAEAIREMLRTPVAGFVPVAVFDDDARGHGLSLIGVPVVGGIEDIPSAAARYSIQQVLLTIPNPAPELVDRALRASEAAGVTMKILPSARGMAEGKDHTAPIRQAREPRIEDLLGRTTVAPISMPCAARSSGSGCSSPAPGARSAPRSPARWRSSSPRPSCCSTTTRRTSTTPPWSCPARASSCSWTCRTAPRCSRRCCATGPTWCSTPPPTSTCPSSSRTRSRP